MRGEGGIKGKRKAVGEKKSKYHLLVPHMLQMYTLSHTNRDSPLVEVM